MENAIAIFCSAEQPVPQVELAAFVQRNDSEFTPPFAQRDWFVSYEEWVSRLLRNGVVIYARDSFSGAIAGAVGFYADSQRYKDAYVSYISVSRQYRKRGIAGKLMSAMAARCAAQGMQGINGSCAAGNQPMQRQFESNGYLKITDPQQVVVLKQANKKDDWDKNFYYLKLS
ncbi:MAG: GNAT family N-acetyltransferase [Candidatus Omnitrophica bacterium]|nr:GNAT family N-acetyltransferase [Candidatus Omnitrophota bacterium]